ncbi:MAG: tetratricopeptide repeat protein, partial [Patescibacteria group bacterium]|nr:tetratricopeptide repeat protein [Patescibacteria group bacterium]
VEVITSFVSAPVLIFAVILAIITIICVKTWRQDRMITFGFLWFFIILLPRTNIWQINRPMYEHWLYLPMIGFWLALFSLLILVFQKIKKKQNKLALPLAYAGFAALAVCILSFSALTVLRNNDWQNAITFYEKNLHYTPNSFIQHNNLGMAYADAGREQEAIIEYRKAIAISDVYPQVHYNFGNSLRALSKTDEAIEEYYKAIKMSPTFSMPYNNLLAIYLEQDNQEKIIEILNRMEVGLGRGVDFLYLKGFVYYKLDEYNKAISAWRELLAIEPSNLKVRELIKNAKLHKDNK